MKTNSIHAFLLCFFMLLQADQLFSMQASDERSEPAVIAYNFVQQTGPINRSPSSQPAHELNNGEEQVVSQEASRPNYDFSNYQVTTATKSIVKLAGAFILFELAQNVFMPEMLAEKWLSYGIGATFGISSLYDAYRAVMSDESNNN